MTDPELGSVVISQMHPTWSLLLSTYGLVRAQEEKSKRKPAHVGEMCRAKQIVKKDLY